MAKVDIRRNWLGVDLDFDHVVEIVDMVVEEFYEYINIARDSHNEFWLEGGGHARDQFRVKVARFSDEVRINVKELEQEVIDRLVQALRIGIVPDEERKRGNVGRGRKNIHGRYDNEVPLERIEPVNVNLVPKEAEEVYEVYENWIIESVVRTLNTGNEHGFAVDRNNNTIGIVVGDNDSITYPAMYSDEPLLMFHTHPNRNSLPTPSDDDFHSIIEWSDANSIYCISVVNDLIATYDVDTVELYFPMLCIRTRRASKKDTDVLEYAKEFRREGGDIIRHYRQFFKERTSGETYKEIKPEQTEERWFKMAKRALDSNIIMHSDYLMINAVVDQSWINRDG